MLPFVTGLGRRHVRSARTKDTDARRISAGNSRWTSPADPLVPYPNESSPTQPVIMLVAPPYASAAAERSSVDGCPLRSSTTPGSNRCHGPPAAHLPSIAASLTPASRSCLRVTTPVELRSNNEPAFHSRLFMPEEWNFAPTRLSRSGAVAGCLWIADQAVNGLVEAGREPDDAVGVG